MTQRQLEIMPPHMACRNGHTPRLTVDDRGPQFGGGLFVECTCSKTGRHADREAAEREWRRLHGIRAHRRPPAPSNVVQLGLRLKGGHGG